DNRAMGLVHRDVSPQNVMISYEGAIKLCDFGIVKAVAKASTTQMGALKGKLQYMSPEQAWGMDVDARSDIFSLGSVMFEVLTGQRLFTGDSEIGVLDAVRDCRVRSPRAIIPSIPEEVEAIVLKALAAEPDARYQTASDLEKDIVSVLEAMKPTPGQGDLAVFMHELFPEAASHPAPSEQPSAPGSQPADGTRPPSVTPSAPAARQGKALGTADGKEAGKVNDGQARAKTLLIAAVVLAALVALALILLQTLGEGPSAGGNASPADSTPAARPAPADPDRAPGDDSLPTQPGEGEGAEGGDGAAGAGVGDSALGEPAAADPAANPGNAAPDSAPGAASAGAAGAIPGDGRTPEATAAPPEGSTPGGEGEGDGGEAGEAGDLQQMINQALAEEQERLKEDFEARKRQLERQIQRVQQEEEGSGGGGGPGSRP
ncbi:MAG: protein kinase, partial [Holophagales bacterium]|nr:protein kinase [Holophagales bacterium]